jgi:hypothetical protein
MRELGNDAIRFSTMPSLGGQAYVVEIVGRGSAPAKVRIYWLRGHSAFGWARQGSIMDSIPSAEYRRLSDTVDYLLASYRPSGLGNIPLCADGPIAVTERLRGSEVVSLTGHCRGPNEDIGDLVLALLCPYIGDEFPPATYLNANRCSRMADRVRRLRIEQREERRAESVD